VGDVSQDIVTAGVQGALARLGASRQAVKDAAAKVYAAGPAAPEPAGSETTPPAGAGR
jgi:hypothetical protein